MEKDAAGGVPRDAAFASLPNQTPNRSVASRNSRRWQCYLSPGTHYGDIVAGVKSPRNATRGIRPLVQAHGLVVRVPDAGLMNKDHWQARSQALRHFRSTAAIEGSPVAVRANIDSTYSMRFCL